MNQIDINDIIFASVSCGGLALGQLTLSGIESMAELTRQIALWLQKQTLTMPRNIIHLFNVRLRNASKGATWYMPLYLRSS